MVKISKKRYMAAVVLISMLAATALPVGSSGTEDAGPTREAGTWLFLIYMAGDNTLGVNGTYGNAAWMDLEELESNHPGDNVEVIVLSDMKGDHNTHLYRIRYHPVEGLGSEDIPLSGIDPTWGDELDMSDWRVLRDFLNYSLRSYSADHIMLTIWDHGSGWYRSDLGGPSAPYRGFAFDTGGSMKLDGLRRAFTEASVLLGEEIDLDIISFDTCSMGTMEVFDQVSGWARMAIGSEDEQPWYGYNYSFVSRMGGSDPLGPEGIARELVRMFKDTYGPTETYATIMAADLTIMRQHLIPSWDNLSRALFEWTHYMEEVQPHLIRNVANRAERMREPSYCDVGDLLAELRYADLRPPITDIANTTLTLYNSMIIDEYHNVVENPQATGLSIYFPSNPSAYNTMYDGSTSFLDFTMDTWWDEFLREFYAPVQRVSILPNATELDGDGLKNDLKVTVLAPVEGDVRIPGAEVYIEGTLAGSTDASGDLTVKDLEPGVYEVIAYNGSHLGVVSVKMMNRPPVAVCDPISLSLDQGEQKVIYALGSYDPDDDPLTYSWDLDDSNGLNDTDSSDQMVTVSYEKIGNRTVRLTVSDGLLSDHFDIPVTVNNVLPVPVLTHPASSHEDEPFNVSGWGSYDRTTEKEELLFHFNIDGEGGNWSGEPNMTISFETSGIHWITLHVRDGHGGVGEATGSIMIINHDPIADMDVPSEVSEDEVFYLDASGSWDTPSDLELLNYTWTISGYDMPEYGPLVEMTISDQGNHTVSLTVADDDGATSSITKKFNVYNLAPVPRISGPSAGKEDELLQLNGTLSSDTVSDMDSLLFYWDTDDDSVPDHEGEHLRISFDDEGDHRVTLWVEDDDGDRSSVSHWISIENIIPSPVMAGNSTAFEDEVLFFYLSAEPDSPSDLGSLSYIWSIDGEELEIDDRVLEYAFTEMGKHKVGIEVIDDQGSYGYDEMEVYVLNRPPVAVLMGIPSEVKKGDSFIAMGHRSHDTVSDLPLLEFRWYIDDMLVDKISGRNLTVEAREEGRHTIYLEVVDDDGVSSLSDIYSFTVTAPSKASLFAEMVMSNGMVLLLMFVAFLFLSFYLVKNKTDGLPAPARPETDMNEGLDDYEQEQLSDEEDMAVPEPEEAPGAEVLPDEEGQVEGGPEHGHPSIESSLEALDMSPPEIAEMDRFPPLEGSLMEEPFIPGFGEGGDSTG